MVVAVVGHGLGLGTEVRIARAIHTMVSLKWTDRSRVRLFNFAKDDFPSYCTRGRCTECDRGNTAALHQLVGERLALPDDCDEWGRLAYEKEEKEAQRALEKKENRERKKRERQEKERQEREESRGRARERNKADEKERSKRERSRSAKRVLKSEARPHDSDEGEKFLEKMTEVDLRKLCQGLKARGMLEDGINYLYLEGTPKEQAEKAANLVQGPCQAWLAWSTRDQQQLMHGQHDHQNCLVHHQGVMRQRSHRSRSLQFQRKSRCLDSRSKIRRRR